ncbi:MAG TPA: zinc-ribbon and DUF3426 domain-containing protein [Steroidobacteraceae bacterium]|nr:zinc-ribbon and DUF3426 domain-containing protein [Steroidobacteraceae bacterium]
MFTVCPKCALTLVVTAADLRVAQGYVRCGRCLNVFNALARLSEERPPTAPETQEAPDAAATQPPEQELTPEPTPEQTPALSLSPLSPLSPGAEDTGEIEIELDSGSVLVTSARGPSKPAQAAPPEPPVEEPAPVAPVPAAAPVASESPPAPAAATVANPGAQPTWSALLPADAELLSLVETPESQQTNTPQEPPESAFEPHTRHLRAGLAWTLGAGALTIALALQIVNHYRDALAANPALTGPLTAAYSALGVKLAPRWNVHAYDVRQLGASTAGAAAGEIVVRASVKNSASRAQPLPLLRVTLQDRFGNRIAARDVPPGDYLPSSAASGALLAAGDRVDATMVFVDPGPQAVGFEIDACLRQQSGEVACAHGP